MRIRVSSLAVVGFIVTVTLAGCTDTGAGSTEGTATTAGKPLTADSFDELHGAAEHMAVWGRLLAIGMDEPAGLAGAPDSQAAALLAEVDVLLRGHTAYVAYATEQAIDGGPGNLAAATDTVGENTDALATRIRELLGEEAGQRFERLWRRHVDGEVRYAQAVAVGDETARQRAREELETTNRELTELLLDHLGQLLEHDTVEEALRGHVRDMIAVMEAQARGEPWFGSLREGFDRMASAAEELAPALAQVARLHGDATAPAAKLHARLTGRMAETVWLTAPLTRLVVADESHPDRREAARKALEEATTALERVVAEALGEGAAAGFGQLWSRHNVLFVDAAAAVGAGDEPLSAVRDSLTAEFTDPLGRLLEQTTDGALQASSMRSEAATHVETVIALVEAQAAR